MKRLTTLFTFVALSIALAGCPTKNAGENKETPVTKPAEPAPVDLKPADPKPAEPTAPAPAADIPTECSDYKAAIEKLATCDKLPQPSRDALKQSYDAQAAALEKITPETKAKAGEACKQGHDALKQAAAKPCGW